MNVLEASPRCHEFTSLSGQTSSWVSVCQSLAPFLILVLGQADENPPWELGAWTYNPRGRIIFFTWCLCFGLLGRAETTGLAWPAALAKPTGIFFFPWEATPTTSAGQRRGWVWGMLGTRKLAGDTGASVRKREGAGGRGRWVSPESAFPSVPGGFPGGTSGNEPAC